MSAPEAAEDLGGLRRRLRLLELVLDQSADVIVTTDAEGLITGFSKGAERVLGYTEKESLGIPVKQMYWNPPEREGLFQKARREGQVKDWEVVARTKDGRRRILMVNLTVVHGEDGNIEGAVGVCRDVTESRALEQKVRRLSVIDEPSGLYNQRHFYERLEVEKERAERLEHDLSLVLFDLDGFKTVNERHGQAEGDQVIRGVGSVLFGIIRKEVDSAFRYGGDEFVVLVPGATAAPAAAFAERIRKALEGRNLRGITASFGVAEYLRGNRSLQIMKLADQAVARAKQAGGNRVEVARPDAL